MKRLFTIFAFLTSIDCFSQAGSLDETFSKDGLVTTPTAGECRAIATQSNGSILTAGTAGRGKHGGAVIIRYFENGKIDRSLGTDGIIHINLENFRASYFDVLTVKPDDKIIAAGWAIPRLSNDNKVLVTQYLPDGTPDSAFGTNGIVLSDVAVMEYITSMQLQPDGKILLAGFAQKDYYSIYNALLVRYLSNGKLDTAFGDNGKVLTVLPSSAQLNSIGIQPDGKIVAGGGYGISPYPQFLTIRYLSNGELDSSYGVNGIQKTDFGARYGDLIHSVAVQLNGKIIAAGVTNDGPASAMAIIRYNSDGALDKNFATDGKLIVNFNRSASEGRKLVIQPDNKILVAGMDYDNSLFSGDFALVRLKPDGRIDSTFGTNGKTTTAFQNYTLPICTDMILQSDNKILLGGNFYFNKGYNGIARYNNDVATNEHIIRITSGQKDLNMVIYPNPIKNVLNIQGLDAGMSYELSVMNAKGNVVAETSVSNTSSYRWNLQSLSKGVYYLNLTSNDKKKTAVKFVKE